MASAEALSHETFHSKFFTCDFFFFNFIPLTRTEHPVLSQQRWGGAAQSSAAQTRTMEIIYHLCSSLVPDGPFPNLFPYVTGREINQASNSET